VFLVENWFAESAAKFCIVAVQKCVTQQRENDLFTSHIMIALLDLRLIKKLKRSVPCHPLASFSDMNVEISVTLHSY
jgi:hypothetical protein